MDSYATNYFAPTFPGLSIYSFLPQLRKNTFYPFNNSETHYFYNARSAIYTLARLLNLENQEILFPTYCCGTDLEPLLAANAVIKPYPVHFGMKHDFDEIRDMITDQTKAIYLIHYLGFPGPVEELLELCKERNIYLIEDCALSLFSCVSDKPLGSYGHASIFSLYKSLPVPSGGVLAFNHGISAEVPKRHSPPAMSTLKHLAQSLQRHFNLTDAKLFNKSLNILKSAWKATKATEKTDSIVEIFTGDFDPGVAKLKMSLFSHWIVNASNPKLIIEKHRYNYEFLNDKLKNFVQPVFDHLPNGVCPLFYAFMVNDNKVVEEALRRKGIEAWAWWYWTHPYLVGKTPPEVEEMRKRIIIVPCHEGLSQNSLERIANEIISVLGA